MQKVRKAQLHLNLGVSFLQMFFACLFYKFKDRWKTQGSLGKRKKRSESWTPGGLPVTLSLLMFVSSSHVIISRSKKD